MDQNGCVDEVEIYQSDDGAVTLHVKTDADTVWLNQAQMSDLFGRDRSVIVRHIFNGEHEELDGLRTRAKMLAAVTLMTAMSKPQEKDSLIRLIGNVIER